MAGWLDLTAVVKGAGNRFNQGVQVDQPKRDIDEVVDSLLLL